ncbi:hypothetical protein GUITHDRAFT_149020, partial [Guillardia theta CCMP2712]
MPVKKYSEQHAMRNLTRSGPWEDVERRRRRSAIPMPYVAVHVHDNQKSSRSRYLGGIVAAFCITATLVLVLHVNVDDNTAARPPSKSISEAISKLDIQRKISSQELHNIYDPQFSEDGVPESETGVFTGHSKGSKNAPLTFGKGTYFNVFDPNPSEIGPCAPGTHGKDGKCAECERGKWCPGNDLDDIVNDCPAHASSLPGSDAFNDCTCVPGWFGKAHYNQDKSCKQCPANMYCPGGENSFPCPQFSSSDPEASQCLCNAAYHGTSHSDCALCPADKYCSGKNEIGDCPAYSSSPVGTKSINDCTCKPSYFEPNPPVSQTSGPSCAPCVEGFYCPGGRNSVQCPPHSSSDALGSSLQDCSCNPGYYGEPDACQKCPAGWYCEGGKEKKMCPASSNSGEGSSKLSECICNAGFYGSSSTGCLVCTIGSFCPGDGTSSHQLWWLTAGTGYYNFDSSTGCSKCPSGSYCLGGSSKADCPAHSYSGEKSSSLQDCSCNPGYYGEPDACQKCPAGWYCEGGKEKKMCPASSNSGEGSSKLSECICNAGFYGSSSTGCNVCTAGSYCPGDGSSHVCPVHKTSSEGSHDCICKPGYVASANGGCDDCPAGSFCSGDGLATLCPPDSSATAGAKYAADCHCSGWFSVASGTWQDVVDACEAQGGVLASIHNEQAWAYGEPQGFKTKVAMTGTQGDQWVDLDTGSDVKKGVCKKHDVQPKCKEGMKPSSLNMNPGFLGKFYFIHHEITKMPEEY